MCSSSLTLQRSVCVQTAAWLLELFIQIPFFLLVSAVGVETVIYIELIGSWSFAVSSGLDFSQFWLEHLGLQHCSHCRKSMKRARLSQTKGWCNQVSCLWQGTEVGGCKHALFIFTANPLYFWELVVQAPLNLYCTWTSVFMSCREVYSPWIY